MRQFYERLAHLEKLQQERLTFGFNEYDRAYAEGQEAQRQDEIDFLKQTLLESQVQLANEIIQEIIEEDNLTEEMDLNW